MPAPAADTAVESRSFLGEVVKSLRVDLGLGAFGLLANTIAGSALVPRVLRIPLLRLAGVRVGRAHVWPGVVFGHPNVTIGDRVTVNRGTFFDSYAGVTLGDRVHVGFQVSFLTASHDLGSADHRCGRSFSEPITVGAGSWIGARATVLPGVTIGPGCVVAAGALVREDCPANGLYAGVPARRVRDLDAG